MVLKDMKVLTVDGGKERRWVGHKYLRLVLLPAISYSFRSLSYKDLVIVDAVVSVNNSGKQVEFK